MSENPLEDLQDALNQFEAKKTEFDSFPVNLLEGDGPINRNGFQFYFSEFLVYQDGKCVFSSKGSNDNDQIIASVDEESGTLTVAINHDNLSDFSVRMSDFPQISTNVDRIMWSKNLLDQASSVVKHEPDVMSLLYKDDVLSRISINILDPNILLEFNL